MRKRSMVTNCVLWGLGRYSNASLISSSLNLYEDSEFKKCTSRYDRIGFFHRKKICFLYLVKQLKSQPIKLEIRQSLLTPEKPLSCK